ncbi:MAG: transketolase [Spirochaetota bacterium]|nr:transketolase [Spirochaetota bacterium]
MPYTIDQLKDVARKLRIECIKMLTKAGSGHPGGSLSLIEIVTSVFLTRIHRTKENAFSSDRHRFVLSKGHGVPAVYAILAHIGIISNDDLYSFRELDSLLQGHPDYYRFPYVEASTGSLGQGLSIAQGMALAGKIDAKNYRIYCVVGDGEMQEGQIWESLMSAAKFKLDNLCVILDYNKGQIDGNVCDVMNIEPLADKIKAFNWHVINIDGHNFNEILKALDEAETIKNKPTFIIANTIKGKGVSFMEGKNEWHGVAPNQEQCELAIKEISAK